MKVMLADEPEPEVSGLSSKLTGLLRALKLDPRTSIADLPTEMVSIIDGFRDEADAGPLADTGKRFRGGASRHSVNQAKTRRAPLFLPLIQSFTGYGALSNRGFSYLKNWTLRRHAV
jgi:hypothetical protein